MNARPTGNKIIVKVADKIKETAGGIFIPEAAQDKPQVGTVMSVGQGLYQAGKIIPLEAKVGDTVMFGKFVGNDIVIDEEKYLIMNDHDILVILEELNETESGT